MVILALTEAQLYKYFEFRSAVDRTAVVYCKLCGRIIFEIHEDSTEDGLVIAQEHLLKLHELSLKAT
jgi:hypothetical protein